MKCRYIVLRFVVNTLFSLILLKCYLFGSTLSLQLIGIDGWIFQLFFGISTALLCNAFLHLAKNTLFCYLKHLQVASLCFPEKNPNTVIFSRFKTFVTIVTLNRIVRLVSGELIEAFKGGRTFNVGFLQEMNNNFFIRNGKLVLTKCFDYMDECVLAYCYLHPEKKIGEAAETAIVIFLEKTGSFLVKTITITLTTVAVKVVIAIFEFCFLVKVIPMTFMNLILVYLVVHVSGFVVNDSIVEPLLLNSFIKEFTELELDSGDNFRVLEELATVTQKLKSLA